MYTVLRQHPVQVNKEMHRISAITLVDDLESTFTRHYDSYRTVNSTHLFFPEISILPLKIHTHFWNGKETIQEPLILFSDLGSLTDNLSLQQSP